MLDLGLEGRASLVAGGSKGIGKGVAFALARQGSDVAICSRGERELEQTANEISSLTGRRVLPIRADMTRLEDVQRFVATSAETFGRIDILVYSANIPSGGTFAEITDETWRYHLDVKLLGCLRCIREVIPHMQKNGWGRIIIIAGTGSRDLRPHSVDNGPVCSALANFGKQIANEVASSGILVNTIHPGLTCTPRMEIRLAREAREQGITLQEVLEQRRRRIPIGRLIQPEDIANLTLFLCSQHASAITGESIAVDGGATIAVSH